MCTVVVHLKTNSTKHGGKRGKKLILQYNSVAGLSIAYSCQWPEEHNFSAECAPHRCCTTPPLEFYKVIESWIIQSSKKKAALAKVLLEIKLTSSPGQPDWMHAASKICAVAARFAIAFAWWFCERALVRYWCPKNGIFSPNNFIRERLIIICWHYTAPNCQHCLRRLCFVIQSWNQLFFVPITHVASLYDLFASITFGIFNKNICAACCFSHALSGCLQTMWRWVLLNWDETNRKFPSLLTHSEIIFIKFHSSRPICIWFVYAVNSVRCWPVVITVREPSVSPCWCLQCTACNRTSFGQKWIRNAIKWKTMPIGCRLDSRSCIECAPWIHECNYNWNTCGARLLQLH